MRESADIIKQFFDREIVADGEGWINLISAWDNIVGRDLSTHLNVKDLKNGTLFINCDHPGWAQIFYLKKGAILNKLRKKFPQLSINRFRVYCDDRNISSELVKNAKVIDNYQEEVKKEKKNEIDPEFSDILKNLRGLGT